MADWKKVLQTICPHGNAAIISGMADSMPAVITKADLTTTRRQAHFLAQCAEESAGFTAWREIASGRVYENRHDLGNVRPGDGPRYKGAGDIEMTGRYNFRVVGKELGIDLENHPDLALTFPTWALIGAIYWRDHHINNHADADDYKACTKAVNGGYNGLSMRYAYLLKCKRALGVS